MSFSDLLKDERLPWAGIRVESLKVDGTMDIIGKTEISGNFKVTGTVETGQTHVLGQLEVDGLSTLADIVADSADISGALGSATAAIEGASADISGALGSATAAIEGASADISGALGSVTAAIEGGSADISGALGSATAALQGATLSLPISGPVSLTKAPGSAYPNSITAQFIKIGNMCMAEFSAPSATAAANDVILTNIDLIPVIYRPAVTTSAVVQVIDNAVHKTGRLEVLIDGSIRIGVISGGASISPFTNGADCGLSLAGSPALATMSYITT